MATTKISSAIFKSNNIWFLFSDNNLRDRKVCLSTEQKDKRPTIDPAIQNIFCVCYEGIFGKYCKFDQILCIYVVIIFSDLKAITTTYYNHCKYGGIFINILKLKSSN
ncbi:hypothetical protein HZS_2909 [Henneguya salminicola]|nr:hypothetical protein HZS_2909 [Henneguya salminicola]